MRLWTECLKEGMNTVDAKMYSKLEIVRLVESGQLSSDMTNLTPLDNVANDPLIPAGAFGTVPSEDRAPSSDRLNPSEDEALEAVVTRVETSLTEQATLPLPVNPPHAPLKLKPRVVPLINNRCIACNSVDPCHQDWCSFSAVGRSLIPPIPPPEHNRCVECSYSLGYHTQWCKTGHRARLGETPTTPSIPSIPEAEFVGPRQPKPGDILPARYPFLKDRRIPYTMESYYAGRDAWDEKDWRDYMD